MVVVILDVVKHKLNKVGSCNIRCGTIHKLNKVGSHNIRCNAIHIIQYHRVTYFVYSLNDNLSGESMALKVLVI